MQERAIKTKNSILRTAQHVFAMKGFSGATIDDIAIEAGVNKQRIYAYFGSKQSLFEAVLANIFSKVNLVSNVKLRKAEQEPGKLTEILLGEFMKIHEKQPDFWRLLAWANLETEIKLDVLNSIRKAENTRIRDIFDIAQEAGLMAPVKFESYLLVLLSVSYFSYSNRQTLKHTLGYDIHSTANRKALFNNLTSIFQQKVEKR